MADAKFDEQWVPIFHSFIIKSPPGHLADVCAACRNLSLAPVPDELFGRACADHNEKQLVVVPLPSGNSLMGVVCESGRAGSRAAKVAPYLDPRTDRFFLVDQEAQQCTGLKEKAKGNDLSEELAGIDVEIAKPFKNALDAELDQYIAEHFPKPSAQHQGCEGLAGSAVFSCKGEEVGGDIELRIMLACRRVRPRGHWAGAWSSQWRIVFVPGQKDPGQLGGIIEFRTHYSEDGNAHFRRKIARKVKIYETTNPEKWAKEMIETMMRVEDEFEQATEDVCAGLGAGTLKSLRRVLPLAKERFDWRPIRHALVRDMKNAENKGER